MTGRILILDNSESSRDAVWQVLTDAGHETLNSSDLGGAMKELAAGRADLLIASTALASPSVGDFLESVRSAVPGIPIILIADQSVAFLPKEAADRGAYGYLQIPVDSEQLRLIVLRALEYGQLMRENRALRGDGGALAGRPLAEIEKQVILSTLERFKGHRLRTATALGIGLRTLGMKLKRWKEEGELIESR